MKPLNKITYDIRGAAFRVHTELGPGLLESAYEACLIHELQQMGYSVERQKGLPLRYKDVDLQIGYRMDMLVAGKVVVELKAVRELTPIDTAQILTYMRLSGVRLGLLLDFNVFRMKDGIKRFIV
ncbi:GxxExxY protein [Neolewinella xylanilytica]|uniref:GxxExxY protein n=1 Tax=Neolewinella xylanilytica TaxID=1514080 RepID=A0A2S6I3B9_9BACT|nr:GxxExxY protein [Neolewinella xylanilytica]PPK85676.1 GxxExxY protein [Neolewinella xylanilytica]